MSWIALKMLTGDRSKYFAIIFGITFACQHSRLERLREIPENTGMFVLVAVLVVVILPILAGSLLLLVCRLLGL